MDLVFHDLANLFFSSSNLFTNFLGFPILTIISRTIKGNFISSFLILTSFNIFLDNVLARMSLEY